MSRMLYNEMTNGKNVGTKGSQIFSKYRNKAIFTG
jgi:hypothetical protein